MSHLSAPSPRRRRGHARAAVCALALSLLGGVGWVGAAAAEDAPVLRRALYPEGPVVIGGDLYVAEMTAHRVIRISQSAASEDGLVIETFFERPGCGPTAMAEISGDRRVVLCHLEGALAIVDAAGALERLITRSDDGVRLGSPNDVSADGAGGAYFTNSGVFSRHAPRSGRLMRLSADLSVTSLVKGLAYANGVAVDAPRGRVLVSEHLARRVLAYPLDARGGLGAPSVLVSRDEIEAFAASRDRFLGPDGIEIAPDGATLIALYGAGRYLRRAPNGVVSAHVAETPYLCNIALWDERLVLVGAYDNLRRPYPGVIEIHPQASARAVSAQLPPL